MWIGRSPLKTAKQEVLEILKNIPSHSSLEDIQYHIYVRQTIRKGLQAAHTGDIVSHTKAIQQAKRWIKK